MTFPRNLPSIRDALELEIDRTRVRLGRLECDLFALDGAETPADVVYEIGKRAVRFASDQMIGRNYAVSAVEAHAACMAEVEALRAAADVTP